MKQFVIGIDEVGRGALAGPVVVAAAMMPSNFKLNGKAPGILKDSKKLSASKREEWFTYLMVHPKISFALARVYPRRIEKLNISGAANAAAEKAFNRVLMASGVHSKECKTYLDGGLFLGSKNTQGKHAKTIVKGDEKIRAVAAASIIAKVSRDRFMCRLGKKHPEYHFEVHKGYGTEAHMKAIRLNGPSVVHRLTFLGARYKV
jgi:ribonuclease HII